MKRGAYRSRDGIFVGAWVPVHIVEKVDEAVREFDLDRSKFVRRAIEDKISRQEVPA